MFVLKLLSIKPSEENATVSEIDKQGNVEYLRPMRFTVDGILTKESETSVNLFLHLTDGVSTISRKTWNEKVKTLCEAHKWGWMIFDKEGNLKESKR